MHKTKAFTLIELLVVVAIVAVLSALTYTAVATARRTGNQGREVSAGRQLMGAMIRYCADHNGEIMPAYADGFEAKNDSGETLDGPSSARYPWRLAAYLDYKVFGTLIVNEQAQLGRDAKRDELDYLVSLSPSFGMNATYVGGNYKGSLVPGGLAEKKYGRFCAMNMSDVTSPARLIVFCSAHYTDASNKSYLGYHMLTAPFESRRMWDSKNYSENAAAEKTGYIHMRYQGKAVAVMFDGHTEILSPKELDDMRRWSIQAAELDLPEFQLGQQN